MNNNTNVRTLTLLTRLKMCYEILTTTSGHKHPASEKQLSMFINGYHAGKYDAQINNCTIKCWQHGCKHNDIAAVNTLMGKK